MTRATKARRSFYANDFDVLNPTVWANEAILTLLPNMVTANLVNRDFDNKVAKFGDVVNALVPATFDTKRKGAPYDAVETQDAAMTSVQVAMNQWPYVAFVIPDGEEDRSQLDLINTLLVPAVQSLGKQIDRIVNVQAYNFLPNNAGQVRKMTSSNISDYILDAREVMNRNNVPMQNRKMILTTGTETTGLKVEAFTSAEKVGDAGTALREAALGRKWGFDLFMTQTAPEITTGQTSIATTASAAAAVGATTLTLAAVTNVTVGMWIVPDGEGVPHQVTAVNESAGTVTITPALSRAVAQNAAVTGVIAGAVNNAAGYSGPTTHPRRPGYAKEILVDGFANSAPQVGQMVTFGDTATKYAIIAVRTIDAAAGQFGIMLDHPLEATIANDATVNLGPAAKYNFGFCKDAFVLVNRPLPQPRVGTISRVVTDPVNKISLRVTISYNAEKQGHLVVIDTLMGVGILNDELGVVMIG